MICSPRMLLRSAFAAAALLAGPTESAPATAGDFGWLLNGIAAPLKATHREPPVPRSVHRNGRACDDQIERLAAEIDWLEHHIDAHGSIVAKQPDVWGQSRLTRHRHEYEEQLRRQLPLFAETSQAALRRSDQAFLGMAMALQAASGRRRGPEEVPVPDATGSASVVNSIQTMLPSTNETAVRSDPVVIARTAPFGMQQPAGFRFADEPLAIEPTLQLDHLSRYLNHLQELRRVNEGDDSADSPGYALNLVRIPVSILPGGRTRKGHGAEITITAEPCLGDDLLPTTFRSLVINDLVDLVAPALTHCINDADCRAWAATIAAPAPADDEQGRRGVMAAMQSLSAQLPTITPSTAPSVKTRRARMPIPVSQLADVAGIRQIAILILDTHAALASHPASRPCIEYADVRGYLEEEIQAAHDFLATDRQRPLWDQLPGWNLAGLVRGRRIDELARIRCHVLATFGTGDEPADAPSLPPADGGPCCDDRLAPTAICRTTTAVLTWGILVESALLNERLVEDMRESAAARGRGEALGCAGPFHGPDPSAEARAAFSDYVRGRWPIRVFALDPASEEQNVEDAFARRRELQIAMAMAFASGRMTAQGLTRFTRRLETDMATIALNKTAVAFSHGPDTFGWRFMPRLQTPPARGNIAAFTESLCGGPTADADLAQRQLEPGIRECTAIVVMPSFVPLVTFDVRTNWFSLAHPKSTDQSMRQTMLLSRSVKAMQQTAAICSRSAHLYRDGEVARLMRRVEQLDRELPLQTLEARIPAENTCGGFELFNTGVTDLAPELIGWYGAPGIDLDGTTTLFLIGRGFSVHDTSVIAGGRPVKFSLLSREVLRAEIPPSVQSITEPCGAGLPCQACRALPKSDGISNRALPVSHAEPLPPPAAAGPEPSGPPPCPTADCNRREMVDIHLATPYGVSSHLLVPVARRADVGAGRCTPSFADTTLNLTFTVSKPAAGRGEAARVDEFFAATSDGIVIDLPRAFIAPPKAALRFLLRDASTGATAATFSFDALAFDARHSRYVIAGGDLRNFVGDTSRPATDKTLRGALKPYLDALLAQGELAADDAALPFTLSAAIVADGQEVPIDGTIAVQATRRGKTVVETTPE